MAPRIVSLVALLTLAVGCSRPLPSTPLERGEALLKSGDYDQALAALTDAVNQDPTSSRAHLLRGRAYHCRNLAGDIDAAVTDFNEAIRLDAKDHEALYSRSIAYRDLGKLAESKRDEIAARRLDEDAASEARRLPELSPQLLPVERPLADAAPSQGTAAETNPEDNESADDLVRRLQSEAIKAERAGKTRPTDDVDDLNGLNDASTRDDSSLFGGGATATPGGSPSGSAAPSAAGPGGTTPPWALPNLDDPLLNPRGPHSRLPRQPTAGSQAPRRSPYVTPGFLPPATGFDAPPVEDTMRPRYQSPIPQRAPRPTGYVEEPLFPGAQPATRSIYRSGPLRSNPLPKIDRDYYQ